MQDDLLQHFLKDVLLFFFLCFGLYFNRSCTAAFSERAFEYFSFFSFFITSAHCLFFLNKKIIVGAKVQKLFKHTIIKKAEDNLIFCFPLQKNAGSIFLRLVPYLL